jgi:hypothetical protein
MGFTERPALLSSGLPLYSGSEYCRFLLAGSFVFKYSRRDHITRVVELYHAWVSYNRLSTWTCRALKIAEAVSPVTSG